MVTCSLLYPFPQRAPTPFLLWLACDLTYRPLPKETLPSRLFAAILEKSFRVEQGSVVANRVARMVER